MTALEFNTKVSSLQETLLGYTRKFTTNSEDANDLVQDTILKALSQREKFINNVSLKGWLFTIMRNTFINKYRKDVRSKTTIASNQDYQYANVSDGYTFHLPHENLVYQEIQATIENLSEKYLVPIQLYIKGYKYIEIAEMLKMPLGTVKVRIFKARQLLKKDIN